MPHGLGIMYYQDGKYDTGFYLNGLLQGMGRLNIENGDICEGHIEGGSLQGRVGTSNRK